MIAIRVRYIPATNTRQARWQATDGRHYLYAPIQYENEEQEKLQLAKEFQAKFLPYSPELNPVPCQYMGFDHFSFYPKADPEKLDDLVFQFAVDNGISTPRTLELIKKFVTENCVLKAEHKK